ncbi:MAG: hypothetical protein FWH41_05020 [Treponema sp.]|nr:hypothetical protein [Treponema sp.]
MKFSGNFSRITFFTGLILLLLIGITVLITYSSGYGFSFGSNSETNFGNQLAEYDYRYNRLIGSGQRSFQYQELDALSEELDKLEKYATQVESWLSVLKRRKQLADIDSGLIIAYHQSSQNARLAYPYSESIAAIAAANLIRNAAISPEMETQLRIILPLLSNSQVMPARFGLHILLGDFGSPQKAAEYFLQENKLPAELNMKELTDFTPANKTETMLLDLAILQILANDAQSAKSAILTAQLLHPLSQKIISLAAEYAYDFDDPLISAELFSMLPDRISAMRQADAFWIAEKVDDSIGIWKELITQPETEQNLLCRSLYNLAVIAKTQEETETHLERLLKEAGQDDAFRQYGLIRYSRLRDAEEAAVMLEEEKKPNPDMPLINDDQINALLELELIKRKAKTENSEMSRIIAETWFLLDLFSGNENLYQWGAWYFQLQRYYSESALLLDMALRHNFEGQWLGVHRALQEIYEGRLGPAEEILQEAIEAAAEKGNWPAAANLGRVQEARREPELAISNYQLALPQLASSKATNQADGKKTASRIWLRIALCHKFLRNTNECRQALKNALELNPDNINAKIELDRLE